MNGIGQSVAATGRFIGPWAGDSHAFASAPQLECAGASLFAWSQSNGLSWPFNFHLTFYVMSAVMVFASAVCACVLPQTLDRKKISSNTTNMGNHSQGKSTEHDEITVQNLEQPHCRKQGPAGTNYEIVASGS